MTRMPPSIAEVVDINLTPYHIRGWCIFEQTVSGIIKPLSKTLDLSKIHDDLMSDTRFDDFDAAEQRCVAHRLPPLSPAAMLDVLKSSKFTNGADVEKVASLYSRFF